MKKQLVSILFALCMVLCLVPLAAFAEGETEKVQVVADQTTLVAAIADGTVTTVRLAADINTDATLTVDRTVTLDLNGFVLKYQNDSQRGSVIAVKDGGQLTIEDSNTSNLSHKFKPNDDGLWVLDEVGGTETVTGGVITGGTGYPIQYSGNGHFYYYGGGVYIAPRGQLTMIGGNIIGCSAEYGGGVCIYPGQTGELSQFSMSGGSIAGCVATTGGGGVYAYAEESVFNMNGTALIRDCRCGVRGGGVRACGTFQMSGHAVIRNCTAESATQYIYGGGVFVNSSGSFVMSEEAKIEDCQAISNSSKPSKGGGVYLTNGTRFTLSGSAVIQNCKADNSVNPGGTYGGGVMAAIVKEITLADNAHIAGCAAANGSGLYITGSQQSGYGKLYANSGSVDGDVVLGDTEEDGPCTITGSGGTVFKGKVTVTPGSTIESGTFNGEVINNGTITGGEFTGTVSNNGTITGGTFSGGITGTPALATGSGTETDPYQISTAEGLKWFRDKVNNATKIEDTQICAELTEDIDLNGEAWTPIGIGDAFYARTPSYSGTFDGKGHTIKNLSIDSSAHYVGLFGYVYGGTIRNLTVSGSVKGSKHTGGIAGAANGGTFENCANQCAVQGGTTGGIIGFATEEGTLIVRDCYNVGSITTTTGNSVGGIIGQCINTSGTIRNCYNAGTVTGTASVGAIIGNPVSDRIYNCYYLDGSVIRNGNGDKVSISKTATEFADGTVLALLKTGERDNNADPWDTTCKYLESAGMTLPVLARQNLTVHAHVWSTYTTDTAAKTHTRSCACGVAETEACTITPATCKDGSACAVCGQQYGGPDTGKHTDLQHFPAVAATTDAEGNKEYWYCGGCGKYFADAAAAREITRADTVTAKLPQPTTPPTATPTAQPTTAPQAAEQPRRTAQPTVQPTAAPTVQPVSTIPATGDTSSPILWAALLLCSGAGLAVTAYKKNRHRS